MKRTCKIILHSSSITLMTIMSSILLNAQSVRLPLKETVENSARYRWEHKPLIDSMLLDNAENPATWIHDDFGTMTFTTDHVMDGKYSIKLQSKTKGEKPTADNRSWGYCSAIRPVAGEDWSYWNRLSMWIYPDLPGHKTVNVYILVVNDNGKNRSRDNIILKNHEWNKIVSEIEFLPRNKVTGVEIRCRLQGNEPGTSDTFTYYVDRLELQKVVPDHYKGWNVAPGKIAFSHTGYPVGAQKSAIASDLKAETFAIVNSITNKVMLSKPIANETTYRGTFQILDFSELNDPGTYYIRAGDIKTPSFRIDEQIWKLPLEKALNFYYVLRTGVAIPGVHDASTMDWHATNGEKTVSLTGGWYDAGDLSQGLNNNGEATLFMFRIAEQLKRKNENPALADRLIEEATWGLDWILKTTLHDGLRPLWAVQAWWSNGIVGDNDDPHEEFGKSANEFMKAAAAEAIGYRMLKNTDPIRASVSLKTAEEDYNYAVSYLEKELLTSPTCVAAASSIIASVELFKATSKKQYAEQALALAPQLTDAQERTYIPGNDKGITGFLYENPKKEKTMHLYSGWDAHEHNQILALADLCEAFPNNPQWMTWYSAVAMFSDLQKKILENTAPFKLVPGGVYMDDEYLKANDSQKEKMQMQLLGGQRIGDKHVVRAFLANDGHFGSLHLVMSQAISINTAARLRGDLEAAQLAEQQLGWTFGCNPFSQSLMYGEGYDYVPQYTPMCGNIVGALPVGMPTFGAVDEPYWPAGSNEPAPKESWVQTEQLFIYLAGELLGPSVLSGKSKSAVQIRNKTNGLIIKLNPDNKGDFRTTLTQGYYLVTLNGLEHQLTVLPGYSYNLNRDLSFTPVASIDRDGKVKIEVDARGTGVHTFEIRTSNMSISEGNKSVKLKSGDIQHLTWTGSIASKNSPWYVVIVPDGDLSQRKEVMQN
jgi:hypothetical protein